MNRVFEGLVKDFKSDFKIETWSRKIKIILYIKNKYNEFVYDVGAMEVNLIGLEFYLK